MGLASLPAGLRQAAASPALVRRLTQGLIGALALQVVAVALDAALPPDLSRGAEASPVALDRRGAWLRALPVEDGRWRIRADLDRTDPSFVARLIAVEDARFWRHPGVDPFAAEPARSAPALRRSPCRPRACSPRGRAPCRPSWRR